MLISVSSFAFSSSQKDVRKCAAMHCDGTSHLYSWPKANDLNRRNLWTKFVQTKRKDFVPAIRSALCFRHFTRDQFRNYSMYQLMPAENTR